jgi:hypothetical protein
VPLLALNEAAVLEQLLQRLHRLEPSTPALWGRMNAGQMLRHLIDGFGAMTSERPVPSISTWAHRHLMKPMALRLPFRWPKGVPTLPEVDAERGGSRPKEFAADQAELATILRRATRKPRDFRFGEHPLFGAMNEWEWMRWAYLHVDHHFRQFGI